MKLLQGKVALITGASRGIGKAIAVRYAQEGCNVAFTDIKRDENMELCEKELTALGIKAVGFASNAASFEDSAKLVEAVAAEFGRIDILVNNALIMDVNLKSVFNLTHACQKIMLKQRSGSIVNMSSVVGVSGNAGQSNYAATKAGIIGFTKSIAQELGSRNIRCNAVAPGFIITDMTGQLPEDVRLAWEKKIPLRRGGSPEEVAKVCVFLGSDLSSYVSGQVISVCGAMNC